MEEELKIFIDGRAEIVKSLQIVLRR